MSEIASNATAQRFMKTFYARLGGGETVETAAQEGRRSIALGPDGYGTRDFATPVIYTSIKEGRLFKAPEEPQTSLPLNNATPLEFPIPAPETPRPVGRHVENNARNGGVIIYTENGNISQTNVFSSVQEPKKASHLSRRSEAANRPTIGLLTALPIEHAAMETLLGKTRPYTITSERASYRYTLGEIPLLSGGHVQVVLMILPAMGLTQAATSVSRLLEHFPSVQEMIMVGIAGGVPSPEKTDDHVRLGDIVVSDQYGVVQYDFIKKMPGETIYRPFPYRPSGRLLKEVRYLQTGEFKGERPWLLWTKQVLSQLSWR